MKIQMTSLLMDLIPSHRSSNSNSRKVNVSSTSLRALYPSLFTCLIIPGGAYMILNSFVFYAKTNKFKVTLFSSSGANVAQKLGLPSCTWLDYE